ncbi:MAG: LIM domain-containing protein [Candidatus Hermodarchaeota archaeon]
MYCSICGGEIKKGEDKYYLEDGKIICQECYNERTMDDKEGERGN